MARVIYIYKDLYHIYICKDAAAGGIQSLEAFVVREISVCYPTWSFLLLSATVMTLCSAAAAAAPGTNGTLRHSSMWRHTWLIRDTFCSFPRFG